MTDLQLDTFGLSQCKRMLAKECSVDQLQAEVQSWSQCNSELVGFDDATKHSKDEM